MNRDFSDQLLTEYRRKLLPTKTLACGCTLGLYSVTLRYCDGHYQQLLDERYAPDELHCEESHERQQISP